MAIVFTKDIREDQLLTAYNNNIVRFATDSLITVTTAQIIGLGIDVLLYPHPNGQFYFNFLDYFASAVNTKNFQDDLDYELISADANSFTYDVSDGCYLEGDILFKINLDDDSYETVSRSIHIIAGVEQLRDYKQNQILFTPNKLCVLSPVIDRTNNSTYLKYWEGYPFEFSIFNWEYPDSPFNIKNNSNGLDYSFDSKGKVTSFFLSDGRADSTIEDFLPIALGNNNLTFSIDDVNQNINLVVDKVDSECGIYIKFLNKYGRWNYWLFSKQHYETITSKYLAEIENNFNNLEDTVSPTLQIGKTSDSTIKVTTSKLNELEQLILDGIIDSPKIFLFTGERFSKSSFNNWIEVRLKTNALQLRKPKTKLYTYNLEFDLPLRSTITL